MLFVQQELLFLRHVPVFEISCNITVYFIAIEYVDRSAIKKIQFIHKICMLGDPILTDLLSRPVASKMRQNAS